MWLFILPLYILAWCINLYSWADQHLYISTDFQPFRVGVDQTCINNRMCTSNSVESYSSMHADNFSLKRPTGVHVGRYHLRSAFSITNLAGFVQGVHCVGLQSHFQHATMPLFPWPRIQLSACVHGQYKMHTFTTCLTLIPLHMHATCKNKVIMQ